MLRSAVVMKPSTLVNLHTVLTKRKYQQLFSPRSGHRPGPKGPTQELIDAVVAMKRRNPTWGCPRIAEQIALAFAVEVDKDVVRRILSTHYRPDSDAQGPSVRPSVRPYVRPGSPFSATRRASNPIGTRANQSEHSHVRVSGRIGLRLRKLVVAAVAVTFGSVGLRR